MVRVSKGVFKFARTAILLVILLSVWATVNLQRNVARDWKGTLDIAIVPVIADQQAGTRRFVAGLKDRDFAEIARYLTAQGQRYGRDLNHAFKLSLKPSTNCLPPVPPEHRDRKFQIALWSLKLRWWAWRNRPDDHHNSQIRIYVLYQSPSEDMRLQHSLGLQNGLIGIIQARAYDSQQSLHKVVITHELLHILGASDKYDLVTGQPIYPDGYASPDAAPLLPQRTAEIMGRAVPLTESSHRVAVFLRDTLIGDKTAREIGWL